MKRSRCWGLHDWTRWQQSEGEGMQRGRRIVILLNVRDCRRCGLQQAKRVMQR